jgi:O-antigen ligase
MPLKNRLLLVAWFFYFCSLPLFKAFASIAEVALVILSLWPGTFSGFKATVFKYKSVAALTLIFGILLLGMFYTENFGNGWKILKHQHRFLIIPLLFLAHARLLQENFRKLVLAFVFSATLACLFVLALYLMPEETVRNLANSTKLMLPYPKMVDRTAFGLYTPFIDRIQFSSLTAVAIISSLYLILTGYFRKALFIALPLLFFTMLILGGRGAQLAMFVALLVYAIAIGVSFLGPKLQRYWGKIGAASFLVTAGLFLFAVLPYLAFQNLRPIQNRFNQSRWELGLIESGEYKNYDYKHFTTLRRIVSVKNMWEVVQQNPVIGVGTGDYHLEITAAYQRNNPEMEVNTHSQYLLFWAMTGIIGLLIFLGVLAYWLFSLRGHGQLYFYGLAILIFYLVNMLPDSVLFTQVDSMVFCSFLSLIGLQLYKPERELYA